MRLLLSVLTEPLGALTDVGKALRDPLMDLQGQQPRSETSQVAA